MTEENQQLVALLTAFSKFNSEQAEELSKTGFVGNAEGSQFQEMPHGIDEDGLSYLIRFMKEKVDNGQLYSVNTNEINMGNVFHLLAQIVNKANDCDDEVPKIMGIKAAEVYLLLMINSRSTKKYFSKPTYDTFTVLYGVFNSQLGDLVDQEIIHLLKIEFHFIKNFKMSRTVSFITLNHLTALMETFLEPQSLSPDEPGNNSISHDVYLCLSEIVRQQRHFDEVLDALGTVMINISEYDELTEDERLYCQQNTVNMIISVLDTVPEDPVINVWLKKLTLYLINNQEMSYLIDQILQGLPRYDRKALHLVLKILCQNPDEHTTDDHINLMGNIFVASIEALGEDFGTISKTALSNISHMLTSKCPLIALGIRRQISIPQFSPIIKLIQWLEVVIKKKREDSRNELLTVACGIIIINPLWISTVLTGLIAELFNQYKSSDWHFLMDFTMQLYGIYPEQLQIIELFVHTVILDVMDTSHRHEGPFLTQMHNMIFSKDSKILIRDHAWLLFDVMISKGLSIDHFFYQIRQHDSCDRFMRIKIPNSFMRNVKNNLHRWLVLSALSKYTVEFDSANEMAELFISELGELISGWYTKDCIPNSDEYPLIQSQKYLTIIQFKKFISADKLVKMYSMLYIGLARSCIGHDEVPAAYLLARHLHSGLNNSEEWDRSMGLIPVMEREVFSKLGRLIKIYDPKMHEELNRDMTVLGEVSLGTTSQVANTTIDLLSIFVKEKNNAGIGDFLAANQTTYVIFLETLNKLTIKNPAQAEANMYLMFELIHTPYPEILQAVIGILLDIHKLYGLPYNAMQEALFCGLQSTSEATRLFTVDTIVFIMKHDPNQINTLLQVALWLLVCDPAKSVSYKIERILNADFIQYFAEFMIAALLKMVCVHLEPENSILRGISNWSMRKKLYILICHQAYEPFKVKLISNLVLGCTDAWLKQESYSENEVETFKEAYYIILCCLPCTKVDNLVLEFVKEYHEIWILRWKNGINHGDVECEYGTPSYSYLHHLVPRLCKIWKTVDKKSDITPLFLAIMVVFIRHYKSDLMEMLDRNEYADEVMRELFLSSVKLEKIETDKFNQYFYKLFEKLTIRDCNNKYDYENYLYKQNLYQNIAPNCAIKFVV